MEVDFLFSDDDIREAYLKLKAFSYYDKQDLNLRMRIAEFEAFPTFQEEELGFEAPVVARLRELKRVLDQEDAAAVEKWISQIGYIRTVKSFHNNDNDDEAKVISNRREASAYIAERSFDYFDGPIELYILNVLWILRIGYKLEQEFSTSIYGNRLWLNSSGNVASGKRLFLPYARQYQSWRDNGLKKAKESLAEENDILILNLDIRSYYDSVRFNFEEMNGALNISKNLRFLHSVFQHVYVRYSQLHIVKDDSNEREYDLHLPVGMPSSSLLANWFMTKVDRTILNKIRPVYYGRYVDDLFLVLRVRTYDLSFDPSSIKHESIFQEYLKEIVIAEPNGSEHRLIDRPSLKFQTNKTTVFYFDHKESSSVIDKLKDDIRARSSEYRFLPEESTIPGLFHETAYELVFDGSLGKLKTLKDYRENRYALSALLAKLIFISEKSPNSLGEGIEAQILTFFRGVNVFIYWQFWERIFTFFLLRKNDAAFAKFYKHIIAQIERLQFKDSSIELEMKNGHRRLLAIATALALSLTSTENIYRIFKLIARRNPELNDPFIEVMAGSFRKSNMLRHDHVPICLLNYTRWSDNSRNSLLEIGPISGFRAKSLDVVFSELKLRYSPRRIRFYEAGIACARAFIDTSSPDCSSLKIPQDLEFINQGVGGTTYLEKAFDVFWKINYGIDNSTLYKETKGRIFTEVLKIEKRLTIDEFHVNCEEPKTKFKVALANLPIDIKHNLGNLSGTSLSGNHYRDFSSILNQVEEAQVDIVVLPELAVPSSLLDLIAERSAKQEVLIVVGLEHWNIRQVIHNYVLTVLPTMIDNIQDAVPVLRLKNHYSPREALEITGYGCDYARPNNPCYHLFAWKGLYFAVFYCFELADVEHRGWFRSKVDLLVGSEYNKDTNYFGNIAAATSRDLHSYYIQVNTAEFGDSRLTSPSATESMNLIQIKGGINKTILVGEINVDLLRKFQMKEYALQKEDEQFKPTPPNFERSFVRARQNNQIVIKQTED